MTQHREPDVGNQYELVGASSAYRDTVLALEHRKKMCEQMLKHARDQNLDATYDMVNRHYKWFLRWYEGVIGTGYLMGRTGVKRISAADETREEMI